MADEKAEVTMSRKEYDALKAGAAPAPAGGDAYDTRGFKTIEGMEDIDTNGDGHISQSEMDMHLEFKRKELEDAQKAIEDDPNVRSLVEAFGAEVIESSIEPRK